mgnify:FL=1
MTAPISLEHFTHLKQPASDYLSQTYQISSQLNDLVEALKQLLSFIQGYTKSSHSLLDKGYIPVKDLEDLYIYQVQGIKYLRLAAKDIETLNGFERYSKALEELEKQEVAYA